MKDFQSFDDSELKKEAEKALGSADIKGKSENEILREIYKKAEAGKRAGTLTNAQIDAFCARFSQMLNPAQQKKLKKLAEQLKNI